MEFHDLVDGIEFMSPNGFFSNGKLTISQNEMLQSVQESPFTIIYKRRQEGVSLAISIYLMWLLVNKPGYSIGFLFSSTNEREVFRQLINMNLSNLEKIFRKQGINMILTPEKHNNQRTTLPNGSTIFYWPKKSRECYRGHTIDFIYISELELKDNFIELVSAIFPLVAFSQEGKILITTTELRNIKDNFKMNNAEICEHWCNSFFDGRRFVITEKNLKDYEF